MQHSYPNTVRILLLIALLIVLPTVRANAQTAAPLTINQLLNASIPNFATDPSQMIALNNGKFGGVDGENYFIGLNTGNSSYAVGDFNNDGLQDIAATLIANGGGTGVFAYLVIFTNKNRNAAVSHRDGTWRSDSIE